MASEATNKLDPSRDSNSLRETEKKQQESSPREEQDTKEFDLKDKRHRTRSEKGSKNGPRQCKKETKWAGNALNKQIEFEDDLLGQSKDIIALTAGLEGLQMKMDSLKSVHETIVNSYYNARVAWRWLRRLRLLFIAVWFIRRLRRRC